MLDSFYDAMEGNHGEIPVPDDTLESTHEKGETGEFLASASSDLFSGELNQEFSGELPEELSGDLSEDFSDELPKELSGDLSEDLSGELSEELSDDLSDELSDEILNYLSSEISDEISDELEKQIAGEFREELSAGPIEELSMEPPDQPSDQLPGESSAHSDEESSGELPGEPSAHSDEELSGELPGEPSVHSDEELSGEPLEELPLEPMYDFSHELNGDVVNSLNGDIINDISGEIGEDQLNSGLKKLLVSGNLSVELPLEHGEKRKSPWFYSPLILLLPLFIIFICSVAMLLLEQKEFGNLNGRLARAVQAITDSENRMNKRLQELQISLLQEISNADKGDGDFQQILEQKIAELQNSMTTLHEKILIREYVEVPLEGVGEKGVEGQSNITKHKKGANQTGSSEQSDAGVEKAGVLHPDDAGEHESAVDPAAVPERKNLVKHKKAVKYRKTLKRKRAVKQLLSAENTQSACFKTYHARDSDTLWNVAKTVYGSGQWYPVLLLHNHDLSIYDISSANQIRYLCDRSLVPALYRHLVIRRKTGTSKSLFWRYRVKHGDTIAELKKRYCSRNSSVEHCMGIKSLPEPGKEILIRLE